MRRRLNSGSYTTGVWIVLVAVAVDVTAVLVDESHVWWRLIPVGIGSAIGGWGLLMMGWHIEPEPVEPPEEPAAPATDQ